MRFRFIWVGKTRDKSYKTLLDEYLRRLSFFVKCEIVEVKDAEGPTKKDTEGNRIIEKVNPTSLVCLLDVKGKSIDSHQLAGEVDMWQIRGTREVTFIIGGSDGVSDTIVQRADIMLSLSFLTFTHEMARVVLVEQLYRAFTIINGFPYQK